MRLSLCVHVHTHSYSDTSILFPFCLFYFNVSINLHVILCKSESYTVLYMLATNIDNLLVCAQINIFNYML